ncbi:hypothetical protein Tco_0558611 [Tanacetum coccineum]
MSGVWLRFHVRRSEPHLRSKESFISVYHGLMVETTSTGPTVGYASTIASNNSGEGSSGVHNNGTLATYADLGGCNQRRRHCGAAFWYDHCYQQQQHPSKSRGVDQICYGAAFSAPWSCILELHFVTNE